MPLRFRLDATFTTVPFAEHAMMTELMEGETVMAVATGTEEMPLRDRLVADLDRMWALGERACVGGLTMLLAVARRRSDRARDYVIFTQQRSASVLNLAGKLALVPKGSISRPPSPTRRWRCR